MFNIHYQERTNRSVNGASWHYHQPKIFTDDFGTQMFFSTALVHYFCPLVMFNSSGR